MVYQEAPLLRDDDDDYMSTPFVSLGGSGNGSGGAESDDKKAKAKRKALKAMSDEQRRRAAIDITMEDLRSRLTVQNVADLVLLSMVSHVVASLSIIYKWIITALCSCY